jgi:hypothetical protein
MMARLASSFFVLGLLGALGGCAESRAVSTVETDRRVACGQGGGSSVACGQAGGSSVACGQAGGSSVASR